jgi:streptogramin lyase
MRISVNSRQFNWLFCVGLLVGAAASAGCANDGEGSGEGDSGIVGDGDGDGSGDGDGDGDGGGDGDGDGDGDGTGDGDGDGDGGTNAKWDLNEIPDAPDQGCGEGDGEPEFSNIWISNSPAGTVSKIDTFTAVEQARYVAGPAAADPSRTSVNLLGDVAVADRNGGVAMIAARVEDCVDKNNNNNIETSGGANDVLPWDTDECVLWHLPLPSSGVRGPRPTAWEPGKTAGEDCVTEYPRLWIGHYHQTDNNGLFYRIDGETGEILDQVQHPWSGNTFGPYGGAVNIDGDFWVLGWNTGPLIKIDAEDLSIQQWATPAGAFVYGMTVDQNGDPWAAGSGTYHHFDTDTETWTSMPAGSSMRGMAAHSDGYIWIADPGGVVKVDMNTNALIQDLTLPGVSSPVGVSIDVEGFVWLVDQGASKAVKVDPDTHQVVAETLGLTSPYTYSDMTGGGLSLVAGGPQG